MSLKSIEDEKLRDDNEEGITITITITIIIFIITITITITLASANPLDKVPLNKMTRGGMRTYGGGIDKVQRRR